MNSQFTVVVVVAAWMVAIIVFTCFAFPRQLEREGFGRLSRNIRARLSFAILNLTIGALFLVISVLLYNPTGISLIPILGAMLGEFASSNSNDASAPNYIALFLSATTAFFTLFASHRWRRLEARILHKLNNLSFVDEDQHQLAETLKTCGFAKSSSTDEEILDAFDWLQRRCSPQNADVPSRSLATKSEKVEELLKIWRDKDWVAILPPSEVPRCEIALRAHEQRKRLASEVQRCIERIENGEADPRDLQAIVGEMGTLPSTDQTNGELPLQEVIGRLVRFLEVVYDDQLVELSFTTAKAVIVSGDDANRRLDTLKRAGFTGVGKVEIIDLDRLVAIAGVCIVLIGVAVYGSRALELDENEDLLDLGDGIVIVVVVFSLTMAFVVGSMVGSLRRLAVKSNPSWSWYLLCATIAVILHVFLFYFAGFFSNLTMEQSIVDNEHFVRSFFGGTILVFFIVLAICRLSHIRIRPRRGMQYLMDTGMFAVIVLMAGALFLSVVHAANIVIIELPHNPETRAVVVVMVAVLLGGVGAYVVGTVRRAAFSRYVIDDNDGIGESQQSRDTS